MALDLDKVGTTHPHHEVGCLVCDLIAELREVRAELVTMGEVLDGEELAIGHMKAQLAEARKEGRTARERIESQETQLKACYTEIENLNLQWAEARKDTERLDFFIETCAYFQEGSVWLDVADNEALLGYKTVLLGKGRNPREAADAAREAAGSATAGQGEPNE